MAFRKDDRISIVDRGQTFHGYFAGKKNGNDRILLDDGRSLIAPPGRTQPSREPHHAVLPLKGSVVEFTSGKGDTVTGTVVKPSYSATELLAADGTVWTIAASRTRPSSARMAIVTHSKGDRVEAEIKGKTHVGTVVSVRGATVTVVLDGGGMSVKGPPGAFKRSESRQEPEPPSTMDRWSVRDYKEVAGHDDSTPFRATVCHDGIPVLHASNDGWGGCHRYDPIRRGDADFLIQGKHPQTLLESDARAFWEAAGMSDAYEPADTWLTWITAYRPFNVTAKAHAEHFNLPLDAAEPLAGM